MSLPTSRGRRWLRHARACAAALLFGAVSCAVARDLALAEAEALLVRQNRELQAARRTVEAAQAGVLTAGARPNATLSLNSASIPVGSDASLGSGNLGQKRIDTVVRLDQPFERGNKRGLRLEAAAGLERSARAGSLDVLRQQLLALHGAYFDLKAAQEKAAVLAETAEIFRGILSAAERRLKAGDLAPVDVARVQVDFERAQTELRSAQAELARAQLALAYLIAAESDATSLRASDPWPPRLTADAAALEEAVEARPDVVAARARVDAAGVLRELALSQRTRDFVLGAQYERYPGSVPANSVGFGVAVPIFTGNDFSGDIRKAEVDRYAAIDELARVRAVALNELRRAAGDLNAAAERLERFEGSLLAAAERSAQGAEFAFQRGATSVLDVLDARRTLRAVRLEALATRGDYARAFAAWRAAQASVPLLEAR